jgi:hypothetical protein
MQSKDGMLRRVTIIQIFAKGYIRRGRCSEILSHLLNTLSLLGNEKKVCESSRNRQGQTQRGVAGGLSGDRCGDERVSFAYDQTGCMNFSLANRSPAHQHEPMVPVRESKA